MNKMKTLITIVSAMILMAGIQMNGAANQSHANSEPQTIKLKITGMTCGGCAMNVSNTLDKVEGVIEQTVEFPGDVAIVKYDADKTTIDELITAIEEIGFKAEIIKEKESKE
jgi:periplasmic mercuric ion binding protein